jgi:putative transposase
VALLASKCALGDATGVYLFLRKQLALFQERKTRPRRTTPSFRLAMVALGKFFDWRDALAIVRPETCVGWQRTAFKIFWRWKSRKPNRPTLPKNLRELICKMARENPTWREERIANELSLKLGIRVSPRTVGKYLERGKPRGSSGQRWTTFVRNHAQAILACDFLFQ